MGDDRTAADAGTISDAHAPTIDSGSGHDGPRRAPSVVDAPAPPAGGDDFAGLVPSPEAHYRITDELARGGMGRVRVARDRRLARWVAIKDVLVDDGDIARRFEREVRITARLQHPSIVSVYDAGTWPSGRPFFAMPLVKGRSLDAAIAARRTYEDRLALLPHVLAVADAIAYAHGERVVHRDLKPANVLVGNFGETVVIDWGVAKSLDDSEASDAPRALPDGDVETVAGAIVGTPAYMPPEQATSSHVDERADVYAIGAILAHVLAGQPPYRGRSTAEVIAHVLTEPPLDIAAHAPDAAPELLAIVARAMAREPAARYPSARELAADLRRFQTGQLVGAHRYSTGELVRRWVRRHRAPLAVAAAGVVALGALGVVTTRRILAERAVAEASRADADDLGAFMLSDVHDRLESMGHLELLDAVARKAAAYYASLPFAETPDEAAERAHAMANIGDVLVARNELQQARAQFSGAVTLLVALEAAQPATAANEHALSHAYASVATIALAQGDVPDAKREAAYALAAADRLVGLSPHDDRALHDRADAQMLAGAADRAGGDLKAARAELAAAVDTARPVVARAPEHVDWTLALVSAEQQLAQVIHAQGDAKAALAHAQAALALVVPLAAAHPDDMPVQEALAQAHGMAGNQYQFVNDEVTALAEFRASAAAYELLLARDPSNARWGGHLGAAHRAIGSALGELGDFDAAVLELRAAMPYVEASARKDPTDVKALHAVLQTRQTLAETLLQADKPTDAIPELHAALELSARIVQLAPADKHETRTAELLHRMLAEALVKTGDPTTALAEAGVALAGASRLRADDPTNQWARGDEGTAHRAMASALHALGRDDDALVEARASLAVATDMNAQHAGNSETQRRIVVAHQLVATVLAARGDRPAALAELAEAIVVARALATPDDHQIQAILAKLEADSATLARPAAKPARPPDVRPDAGWIKK
nr:serine/threonine-protein kinase [Kofleriaceae bacterium]